MAKEATLQVRMDADIKERVERLYTKMGTTFAEGVRIFAVQSLLVGGIPITIRATTARAKALGSLAKYADPKLAQMEGEAFRRAMEEKHGTH